MKRRLALIYAVLIGVLVVPNYSCETETLIGTFTATIGSESWAATAPAAVKTGNRFTITGTSISPGRSIVININGITAGTYDMNVFSTNIQPFIYTPDLSNPQNTYIGNSGTITVSLVTENRISGTFNVVAQNLSAQVLNINGNFTNVLYSF